MRDDRSRLKFPQWEFGGKVEKATFTPEQIANYRTWRSVPFLPTRLVPFGGQPDNGAEQDAD